MPHSPLRFADTQASVLLDAVRGLAALCVLLEHWRNVFFVDYGAIASHRLLWAPLYLLVSAGHQAVVIFFVLSGFLISGSVFRMVEKNRWSWRTYSVHRLLRLWIVLVPALLLTAAFDRTGMHLHRAPAVALYAGLSGDHVVFHVQDAAGWRAALGNFGFLQGILVPPFGTDGALWSLANEFWYYALFPLGFTALRLGTSRSKALAALLFVAIAAWLPHGLALGFLIWLLGTLLAVVRPPELGRSARWLATAAYVPVFFAFARASFLQTVWADYALGVVTFGFLWVLLSARAKSAEQSLATRSTRTLARFSFTLYAVHTPLLALIAALILPMTRWQPSAGHMLTGGVVLLAVIAFAWAVACATEFRTDRVRQRIERGMGISPPPAPG